MKLHYLIFCALCLLLAGCDETLYSDLDEAEANEMLEVLASNGIEASKVKAEGDRYRVTISEARMAEGIRVLKEYGLPREKMKSMGEIFKQDGLVSSPFTERVRYVYGLSQSIQETLMQIDGVLTARVQVVLPEDNPYVDDVKPSSTAVYIKHHPDVQLEPIKRKVKLLVEKSIKGLSYNKISVVMMSAKPQLEKRTVVSADRPVKQKSESSALFSVAYLGLFGALGAVVYVLRMWGQHVSGITRARRAPAASENGDGDDQVPGMDARMTLQPRAERQSQNHQEGE